mmetsp:Transcript_54659/g.116797  ORF Transcript_54659/g.116797 Transcript_54659/m.116797 type:complete len:220 (+) Transcript_54659:948-1607(+)
MPLTATQQRELLRHKQRGLHVRNAKHAAGLQSHGSRGNRHDLRRRHGWRRSELRKRSSTRTSTLTRRDGRKSCHGAMPRTSSRPLMRWTFLFMLGLKEHRPRAPCRPLWLGFWQGLLMRNRKLRLATVWSILMSSSFRRLFLLADSPALMRRAAPRQMQSLCLACPLLRRQRPVMELVQNLQEAEGGSSGVFRLLRALQPRIVPHVQRVPMGLLLCLAW